MTLNGTREDQVERMKNAEKIEALRRWAKPADDYRLDGYYQAQCQVRDIIDPPRAKWRELVDDARSALLDEFKQPPLPTVLSDLAEIADDENDPRDCLACIVAICEQEVGDGWQADPDDWPDSWDDPVDVWSLLDALCDTEDKWQSIGDRAATWLRSLSGYVGHS
jgi:hypothetical protein